jgi:cold shock protein
MTLTGTVRMYRTDNGWGFIQIDGGMGDIFVHHSALAGGVVQLVPGQRVSFSEGTNPKNGKSTAEDVRLLDAPAPMAARAPKFGDAIDA